MTDLNKQVYSWLSMFFLFAWRKTFLKKILLYDSLVWILNNSFLFLQLRASYIYIFSGSPWFFETLNYSSTWTNLSQNNLSTFFLSSVLKIIQLFEIFSTHLEPPKGTFWDTAHPHKLFMSQFFIFVIIFHVSVISFQISVNSIICPACNTFFYH